MILKFLAIRIFLYAVVIFCTYYGYLLFAFQMGYADDATDHTTPLWLWSFAFFALNILIDRLLLIRYYSHREFFGVSAITVLTWIGLLYLAYH